MRTNELSEREKLLSVYRGSGARVVCSEADRASAPALKPQRTFFFNLSFLSIDHDTARLPPLYSLLLLSVFAGVCLQFMI